MLFESRCFWHPKSVDHENEYEDAYAVGDSGSVAIADGVSSAIFSRQWSNILTQAVVKRAPDFNESGGFQDWLVDLRADWRESIDFANLGFFQKQKLQQVKGAFATLLWVEFYEMEDAGEDQESPRFLMRCFAVGDCCLFHIRNGQLLHRFPIETVEEFEKPPLTIGSVDLRNDHLLEFGALEEICEPDDFVFLISDALAKWIYQQLEAEEPVDWDELWNLTEDEWHERVEALRDLPLDRRMRIDDTTLVMLRMGAAVSQAEEEQEAAEVAALEGVSGEEQEGREEQPAEYLESAATASEEPVADEISSAPDEATPAEVTGDTETSLSEQESSSDLEEAQDAGEERTDETGDISSVIEDDEAADSQAEERISESVPAASEQDELCEKSAMEETAIEDSAVEDDRNPERAANVQTNGEADSKQEG